MASSSKHNGFTLIEAMMAMVILSIAAAGILLPFASSAAVQAQGNDITLATKLVTDMVEMVLNTNYENIVSTYGLYNEAKGALRSPNGGVMSDNIYADFMRSTRCEEVYVSQQDGLDNPNFIKVTVTVYQNTLKLAELTRLVSK